MLPYFGWGGGVNVKISSEFRFRGEVRDFETWPYLRLKHGDSTTLAYLNVTSDLDLIS